MAADVETPKRRSGVKGTMLVPPVIAKAIIEIQKELEPLVKSETNDEYGSGFVPLHEVTNRAIKMLASRKIAVMQPVVTDANDHLALCTMLVHESGVGYEATSRLALDKPSPQGHGSAITYARRYNLMSMLGMTAKEDDDDGNKASGVLPKVTEEQRERLTSVMRHLKMPVEEIAKEQRNMRTRDHAEVAILNYEKMIAMRRREHEAEDAAISTEASTRTHIPVSDEDSDGGLMQEIQKRITALGLASKKAEHKFVNTFTTSNRPWLSKCSETDLEELGQMLDIIDAGVRTLPNDWYAAGHPPIKTDVSEPKEKEEPTS